MRARDLTVKCGLDWGNASPGCIVFGASLPDETVHIWDEIKFQRETAKQVAEKFLKKCDEWKLKTLPIVYCDPSLLPSNKKDGGEYIGLTLMRHGMKRIVRANNDRVNGWQRVHEALSEGPDGQPWLTVHPRCKYLTRTIPQMVQADNDPEDLDTDADDHACDALRYLLMGGLRPGKKTVREETYQPNTWGWWKQHHERMEEPGGVLA